MVSDIVFHPTRPWRIPLLGSHHLVVPLDLILSQVTKCGETSVLSRMALPESWLVREPDAEVVQLLLLQCDPAPAALSLALLLAQASLPRKPAPLPLPAQAPAAVGQACPVAAGYSDIFPVAPIDLTPLLFPRIPAAGPRRRAAPPQAHRGTGIATDRGRVREREIEREGVKLAELPGVHLQVFIVVDEVYR